MDTEFMNRIINGYTMLIAWIGSGSLTSREFIKEAYRQRHALTEFLQAYSGKNLEGMELVRYVSQKIQNSTGA